MSKSDKQYSNKFLDQLNNIQVDPDDKEILLKIDRKQWPDNPSIDISIIVPVYNVGKDFLNKCIYSILNQQCNCSFELIIIDDGSTDQMTIDALNIFETLSSNVTVIHQLNMGLSGARNTGINLIQGKTIMFVDSDDMLDKNCLQVLWSAYSNNECDFVTGNYFNMNCDGAVSPSNRIRKHGAPWGRLYNREIWRHLHFPVGYWFEDTIQAFCIDGVWKEYYINYPVYRYRLNPDGITANAGKSLKALDTFWVTKKVLEWRRDLGYPFNRLLLDCLLNQFAVISLSRTYKLNLRVQKIHFKCMCILFNSISEFKNMSTSKGLLFKCVEWSLRNQRFYTWLLAVLLIKYLD